MESQARRTSLRSSTQKHGQPETQLQQQQQHHDETPSPEAATTNLESTTRESSVLTPATSIGTSTHRPNAQPTASTATSSKTGLGGAPSTTEPTDSLSEVSDDAAPALQPEGSRSSRGKKAKAAALASPKRLRSSRNSNVATASSVTGSAPQPSARSLGKRRHRSPTPPSAAAGPLAPAVDQVQASASPTKRQKRNSTARSQAKGYNLRSRPNPTPSDSAPEAPQGSRTKRKGKGKAEADSSSSPPEVTQPTAPTSTRKTAAMPRRPRASKAGAAAKDKAALAHSSPIASGSRAGEAGGSGGDAPEIIKDQGDHDGDVPMAVASPVAVQGVGIIGEGDDLTEHAVIEEDEDDEDEDGDASGSQSGSQSGSDSDGGERDDGYDGHPMEDDGAYPEDEEEHPSDEEDAALGGGDPFDHGEDDDGTGGLGTGSSRGDALAAMGAMSALGSLGFGGLGGLSGLMSGFTGRLKNILASLKQKGPDASTNRLVALQELAEILAVSTEDTLAGYFQTDAFSKELVAILKGGEEMAGDGGDEDDAAMAAALAASMGDDFGGGAGMDGREVEHMLLASRCLANLMEALPGASHTVVHHGAVPVLCAKLLEIQFIDLAEQCLSTLEKISEEMPHSIVREGGLTAILQYLDFFSTNVQRTAVTAAANCCRGISPDSFSKLKDVFPILKNVVSYPDQRVSEQAVLAITRVMDSYRHHPDKLDPLVTSDVLAALMGLLSPVGGAKISDNIFTSILKSFTNVARGSPEMAANLLDAGLADSAYGILVGQTPPETADPEQLAKELTENTSVITQALMRRDKAHVQQTLDLIVEALPPLPKDGVFDSKLAKSKKSTESLQVKQEEMTPSLPGTSSVRRPSFSGASTSGAPGPSGSVPAPSEALSGSVEPARVKQELADDLLSVAGSASASASTPLHPHRSRESAKEAAIARRIELLHLPARADTVQRFHALLLPTLIDVYGASVSTVLRQKALAAMLKIAHFSRPDHLSNVLRPVPMASFLASILANRDQPSLVVSALQLSDLLLTKLPDDFHFFFRREGVMHEIDKLAEGTPGGEGQAAETGPSSTELPDSRSSRAASSIAGSFSTLPSLNDAASAALMHRAQHIRDKHAATETDASRQADELLAAASKLAARLPAVKSAREGAEVLEALSDSFMRKENPISSFELAQSGLVDALLRFATEQRSHEPDLATRKSLVSDAFIGAPGSEGDDVAFVPLVKRLQESLSRLENFDVRTASGSGSEDARKGSTSLLGRQIKFRLTAVDPTDIPSTCRDVIVAIHAIAKLDAIDMYIRPRIIKAKDEERTGIPSASASASRLAALAAALQSGSTPPSPSPTSGADRLAAALGSAAGSSGAGAGLRPNASHAPRRSSRLSGRGLTAEDLQNETKPTGAETADTSVADPPPEDSMDLDTPDISATGFAAAVEGSRPSNAEDPLVNVQPARDGSKMEASTPQGTRITTPQGSRPASAMSNAPGPSRPQASSSRPSYAAAVKSAPKDWHLEYFIGSERVPLDSTVYGAIVNSDPAYLSGGRSIWNTIHTLTFKRVPGPDRAPTEEAEQDEHGSADGSPLPPSVENGSQQGSILRLLRAMHNLHLDWKEFRRTGVTSLTHNGQVDETLFINNKLTAKLNRQLEEPMIIASNCLPGWACELPLEFYFLFPFETRYSFLKSTSFGYPRLIQKWLQQARANGRGDDHLSYLGKLARQKVRVSRHKVLESLEKILSMYAKSQVMLEIEYFDEVGTGLGPTLEFFSLASHAFAEKAQGMWRDHTTDTPSAYVFSLAGLFPAPLDEAGAATSKGEHRIKMFRLLGQFMAKALMDDRIVDISLSRIFARLILGYDVPLTIRSVRAVDKSLAASLEHLQQYVEEKATIESDPALGELEKSERAANIRVDAATIDDLALDFTLPGYDIELKPGSANTPVTIDNVAEYIQLVIEWSLVKGVERQIEAFRQGFSIIFPIRDLQSFTPEEVVNNVFGNSKNEDWSEETIVKAIRPDHGFNIDSTSVRDLISIISAFDTPDRRSFLQFITGAPKLPVGGFRGLHPPLTVVRKGPEAGRPVDEQLPSVMTCVNYLKLPVYSTKAVAEAKIRMAMKEGADSFHLS